MSASSFGFVQDTQLGVLEQRNAMLEREAVQSSAGFQERIRKLERDIEVGNDKAEKACNENVGLKAQLDALRGTNQRLLMEMVCVLCVCVSVCMSDVARCRVARPKHCRSSGRPASCASTRTFSVGSTSFPSVSSAPSSARSIWPTC